jgi:hypothetical protein
VKIEVKVENRMLFSLVRGNRTWAVSREGDHKIEARASRESPKTRGEFRGRRRGRGRDTRRGSLEREVGPGEGSLERGRRKRSMRPPPAPRRTRVASFANAEAPGTKNEAGQPRYIVSRSVGRPPVRYGINIMMMEIYHF